jgi:NAD(P)-dependent dehydrogenase (short-subunit alcohol dehydrogenase family)
MIEHQWGNIVLMWSDQSLIGKKKSSIYGATKAAIGQLTKSTALDYAEYGIRVNTICPWTIDTAQAARAADNFAKERFNGDVSKARDDFAQAQAIKRLWTPEEVAQLVCFLLSDQAAYMTGTLVSIDGGYVAG